jgi:hypothetical protein
MEFCLVYISSSSSLSANELGDLLHKSQENNRSLHITGVLLYCNGSIIQVLEGEQDKVNALYKKIAVDHRHRQVTLLYSGSIQERSFGDWLMGYKTLTTNEMNVLQEEIPVIKNPNLKSSSRTIVMSLVETFYRNNHRN